MVYFERLPLPVLFSVTKVSRHDITSEAPFGGRFWPHKHESLVGYTVVHPKVEHPELPGIKHLLVLEVEGQHVDSILSPRLELTSNLSPFPRPALYGCSLVHLLFSALPIAVGSCACSHLSNDITRHQFRSFFIVPYFID